MPLAMGSYSYKLRLNDSQWIDDPANPVKQPDGLGGLNSMVEIPRGTQPHVSADSPP